jgi:hypothetical protein
MWIREKALGRDGGVQSMQTDGALSPLEGHLAFAGGEKCDLFWILRGTGEKNGRTGMLHSR